MYKNLINVLIQINEYSQHLLGKIEKEKIGENNIGILIKGIEYINKNIPNFILNKYGEFFSSFAIFCTKCSQSNFIKANIDMMKSSLELYIECVEEIKTECSDRIKECICCKKKVIYNPISQFYTEKYEKAMGRKYETLNTQEYMCPFCGSSDRDRLILSFLEKEDLQKAKEDFRVLQFAPAKVISDWIMVNCPHVCYETTDLFMDGVSYKSDIQNMRMIKDNTYDLIICSHVLEHVKDDKKAFCELKRILKNDGKIVFLVPVDLNATITDEEWGLTEEQNWERFGQGDHCRLYNKEGLQERLEEQFYVWELDEKYFTKDVYFQSGLIETSVLYVLTKTENVSLELAEKIMVNHRLCQEGPLVSVILPCYNHEEYVAEAVESILNQSYKHIEIIVADDCSTDRTADVLRQYSQYFAKEIYLHQNTGATIAHELLKYAKGKYVALAHSDDIWDRDKIAMQVEYMEKHQECGICFTWCRYVDDNLNELDGNIFIKGNKNQYEWMEYFWEKGNTLCNPSSLSRIEVALRQPKYGYNLWRQLPDFFKWVDRIQEYSIHIIPKSLVKMRWHSVGAKENTSASTQTNVLRHMIEEGSSWLGVIRDMPKEFFKKAFCELMINPDAQSEAEIKCEKFFLLLRHHNVFVQNTAFIYLCEIYTEIDECLKNKYGYSRNDLATDMVDKGIVQLFNK